ncbi:hypothetical protein SGLAM104S_05790 [Streptomyces glaucescens]
MRLIADGVVDREGVPGLAARLGYSTRQVERQLLAELGAGPLALARAQRAQTARLLIETTALPMAEIAFAAGFASIRTFNDTVREVYALTPSDLRARTPRRYPAGAPAGTPGAISLRLPFRAPLNPDNLFGHLAATAVPGVEEWRDGAYRRTLRLPYGHGIAALSPRPDHIACRLTLTDLRDLPVAISRCRRLLDLDADPVAVDDQLRTDPVLAPLVDKAPGRRVPRTVDEAEFAVRAVLGQQVSTAAARTHAARLVGAHGESVDDPEGGLTHLFPSPGALAAVDPETLAMPRTRRATFTTLVGLARRRLAPLGCGERLAGSPCQAPRPPRLRPVDGRRHRDARPRRPRRLPPDRPRHPPRRPGTGPALHPGRAHRPRGGLAALAGVCRPVPVGDGQPPHQLPAGMRSQDPS